MTQSNRPPEKYIYRTYRTGWPPPPRAVAAFKEWYARKLIERAALEKSMEIQRGQ